MSRRCDAAFAIPGDIATLTGGYIYERRLLEGLRDLGHDVRHLQLPAGFPDPSPAEMAEALEILGHEDRPLILDGLVFGALDTPGLARLRAPVVAMIHHPLALETGLDPARRMHLYRTERDNLRLARHVLVPSRHSHRILTGRYHLPPDRITIARPGVERPRLAPDPATPPLILSVGILHPRKGHDLLITALAALADLDWQAVIVGNRWDHDHAAALARQLAESPVSARVTLAGPVDARRLQQLYASASIFALATRYEGHGLVFDEALVHGLPIVSCRTGAVPDTVPPGTGLLVPPGDPRSFAAALRRLLEDRACRDRLRSTALRAGAALPGWHQTAAAASEVLQHLASLGARSARQATQPRA